MPARHRDQLLTGCEGRLTLTRHPDGCLLVYPRPEWETKSKEVAALPFKARGLQRLLLGSAIDVELDNAGRLLIPGGLREEAGLAREAMLIGMGNHLELWEPGSLRESQQSHLANGLPESAADFSF